MHARLGDPEALFGADPALSPDGSLPFAGIVGVLDEHGPGAALHVEVDQQHGQQHEDSAGHDHRHEPGREAVRDRKDRHQQEEARRQPPQPVAGHRLVRLDVRPLLFSQRFRQDGHAALERAHPIQRVAETRHRALRHRRQRLETLLRFGGLAQSFEALRHDHPIGPKAIGLAGALEHVPALGQGLLGADAAGASLGQGVAIVLQLLERGLAAAHGRFRSRNGLFRDLEAAGVLVAARLESADRLLETGLGPRAALVTTADAALEPVSQRAFVAVQILELFMADRGGGAEKTLVGDAGQLGDDLVGPSRVGVRLTVVLKRYPAALAAELLLQDAVADG